MIEQSRTTSSGGCGTRKFEKECFSTDFNGKSEACPPNHPTTQPPCVCFFDKLGYGNTERKWESQSSLRYPM